MINIGDFVTRKSYGNDIVFEVIEIEGKECILKGAYVRLMADAPINDLVLCDRSKKQDDFRPDINLSSSLDRNEFFYLPGKVLHIDADKSYLSRCMDFYKKNKILAYGKNVKESDMYKEVPKFLIEYNPDILILTGHDAYFKKRDKDNKLYKNSENFCKAVREARKYEKSSDKLIIIAGACQSNYEELIKSGATFASSPKRINIHALDPAIIATKLSLLDRNENVDLIDLLSKTKYGKDGIGGLISKGTMYKGYPRSEV